MTGEERDRRDSRALEPELITDPQAKAVAEARNGFRQYDAAIGTIHYAGNYRPGGAAIEGSKHEPVGAHLVPELVEDMCDYVNDHWNESTPIHLASLFDVAAELDSSIRRR
jgi:hypothetical protein